MVLTERLPPLGPGAKKEDRDAHITEEFLLPANEENRVRAKTGTADPKQARFLGGRGRRWCCGLLRECRQKIASTIVESIPSSPLEILTIADAGGMGVSLRFHTLFRFFKASPDMRFALASWNFFRC